MDEKPDNIAQRRSAAYRLAELDSDFLLGDSMRGVRFLLEYAKAEERLRDWGIRSTIVVFGSSNVVGTAGPRFAMWYERARQFARIASERGGALAPINGLRNNVIMTGGGPGLMEAANRGAFEAGAPSIGLIISLADDQQPNPYTTPDLTFQFRNFGMRKMHLAMRAAALVAFPGGFGTFDELFEILTLIQTRKAPALPVLCFDRDFWSTAINFEALIEEGMISEADYRLLTFVDDVEEGWQTLVDAGLLNHKKGRRKDDLVP